MQLKHHNSAQTHCAIPSLPLGRVLWVNHLRLISPIKEKHYRHQQLPGTGHHQRRRRAHLPEDERARQRAQDQRSQEPNPPVPRPVFEQEKIRINHQVHPRGGRHGRGDLGQPQRPRLHDLAAGGARQQADGPQGARRLGAVEGEVTGRRAVGVLQAGGGEDEAGLEEVAEDEPAAAAGADDVAQLAGQPGGGEEEAEGDADVGGHEHVAVGFGDDDGQDEEDGVACLVGGEAVEVGKGDGICGREMLVPVERGRMFTGRLLALEANAESKDEEFNFSKTIGTDIFVEIAPCSGEC